MVKLAVVAEANSKEYKDLLRSKGLRVEEKKSSQKTLDGGVLGYHAVTGYREGAYKITIRLSPEPKTIHFVVNAKDNKAASKLADKLDDELGIASDVDEEVVRGQTRRVTKNVVKRIVELAEEATR